MLLLLIGHLAGVVILDSLAFTLPSLLITFLCHGIRDSLAFFLAIHFITDTSPLYIPQPPPHTFSFLSNTSSLQHFFITIPFLSYMLLYCILLRYNVSFSLCFFFIILLPHFTSLTLYFFIMILLHHNTLSILQLCIIYIYIQPHHTSSACRSPSHYSTHCSCRQTARSLNSYPATVSSWFTMDLRGLMRNILVMFSLSCFVFPWICLAPWYIAVVQGCAFYTTRACLDLEIFCLKPHSNLHLSTPFQLGQRCGIDQRPQGQSPLVQLPHNLGNGH